MKVEKIFAVIDPASSNSRLINRILSIATHHGASDVTAYCCIYSTVASTNQDELHEVETRRYQLWLEQILAPLKEAGLAVTVQLEWDPEWREAIRKAAKGADCDLVIKNSYSNRPGAKLAKSIDKSLLRSSRAPVMLLRRETPKAEGIIAAAYKTHDLDDAHKKLNDDITSFCKSVSENNPAMKFHAVSTYSGSDNYIHKTDFAKSIGADTERVHTYDASAVEGIIQFAEKHNVEIMVVGTVVRRGVARQIWGNTVEELLEKLPSDIITIIEHS